MTLKSEVINEIISLEGGYVYNPDDSGGETNFGITKQVAEAHGYLGRMVDLPREKAFDIYTRTYWNTVRADVMEDMSKAVTREVVDTCVNMGSVRAVKFLQRALNVLNNKAKLYEDLTVDGVIGSATFNALKWYCLKRDEVVLVKALNCLQGNFYIELAERRVKDESFVYGWLTNRVSI